MIFDVQSREPPRPAAWCSVSDLHGTSASAQYLAHDLFLWGNAALAGLLSVRADETTRYWGRSWTHNCVVLLNGHVDASGTAKGSDGPDAWGGEAILALAVKQQERSRTSMPVCFQCGWN